jgi:hypothetical protein
VNLLSGRAVASTTTTLPAQADVSASTTIVRTPPNWRIEARLCRRHPATPGHIDRDERPQVAVT